MKKVVINLDENEFPKHFYNVLADLPEKVPAYLNPATNEPVSPKMLESLFPVEMLRQEFSEERYIPIPQDLRQMYIEILKRPRPLVRAIKLEEYLNLPENIKIYYKREDLSPTGSHKTNTSLAQLYYAKKDGVEFVTTETGAGQWGTAVSFSAKFFDIKAEIYMVKISYEQKPLRKIVMNLFGGTVFPSPSTQTKIGRKFIEQGEKYGSLGIAISEAVESAITKGGKYVLGSVLNSVLLHQTVIGEETIKQLESIDETPTHLIACFGGGSNFGGLTLPFYRQKKLGKNNAKIIAVEPKEVPTLSKGNYKYDFADTGETTPLIKMFTLDHKFIPPPIYAGGLRYHGSSPIASVLAKNKLIDIESYNGDESRQAGMIFSKTEGIIPAPETAHAIASAIKTARQLKKDGKPGVIVVGFSGHGLLDLKFYDQ